MNKTCETVGYYTELLDEESVIQRRISLALGRYIVKFGDKYDYSSERLFRELCKMKGMPEENWEQIMQIENYQLKVKILLDGHDIWRRILIPSRCTFRHLHRVIQELSAGLIIISMSLPYRMIHMTKRIYSAICLADKNTDSRRDDPEVEDYLEPDEYEVRYDNRTSLREIFSDTERCLYMYDFGDDWMHEILLEKVNTDSHNRFPVLMESNGEDLRKMLEDRADSKSICALFLILNLRNMSLWSNGLR